MTTAVGVPLSHYSLAPSPSIEEQQVILDHLPQLEAAFVNNAADWVIPLGDNWMTVWNWAVRLQKSYDIDARISVRVARDLYPFDRGVTVPPEWE
jgi:hypothetical protein